MNGSDGPMCGTEEIQRMIANEFPSHPYEGIVMEEYHPPSVYESEGDDLNTFLKGKTWRDLIPDFVNTNEDEYVLMNGIALVAFLGAWLWRAAEDLGGNNQVRSSLIFHLASYGTGLWKGAFKSLNQSQRDVIHSLLKSTTKSADQKEKDLIDKVLRRNP
jgi:hypothetical protein